MQFTQLQSNPKKNFATSKGFEPMDPALALQCSNQLSYEQLSYGFWEENVMELLSMLVSKVFLFFSLKVLSSLC